MDRQTALILVIIFFTFFLLLTYYGAKVTLWSSIVFSLLLSLILLNIFYPLSQMTTDDADFSLVVYALIQILSVIILAIYVTQKTLSDTSYYKLDI